MLKAQIAYRRLDFRFVARTSRDALTWRDVWYLKLFKDDEPEVFGTGEFNYFPGLGSDATPDYPQRLEKIIADFNRGKGIPRDMSSVNFAFETAIRDLANGGIFRSFDNDWAWGRSSIPINGLIWMGDFDEMSRRVDEKLDAGFDLLKIKIGGIDFASECALLDKLRRRYSLADLTLRLDANGSFTPENALERLQTLSRYGIHSIEQPIKAGQWEEMARLCESSPIAIALDEELIGVRTPEESARMLNLIRPSYIILKPALCGGLEAASALVSLAEQRNIGWWATSALESDIGLNAIAQWTAQYQNPLPHGLGTGLLYHNNIPSPIRLRGSCLSYDPSQQWDLSSLKYATVG